MATLFLKDLQDPSKTFTLGNVEVKEGSVLVHDGNEYKVLSKEEYEEYEKSQPKSLMAKKAESLTNLTYLATFHKEDGKWLIKESGTNYKNLIGFVDTDSDAWKLYFNEVREKIELGDGADSLKIGSTADGASIALGGGNNSIVVSKAGAIEISAEDGKDEFTLTGLKDTTVRSGAGKDVVTFGGDSTSATVDLGDGDDQLVLKGVTYYGLDKGVGQVTATLGEGKDTVDISQMQGGTVTLTDFDFTEDKVNFNPGHDVSEFKFAADGTVTKLENGTEAWYALKFNEYGNNGFYAVSNTANKTVVAWANEKGSNIDASSMTSSLLMMGDVNEASDTLLGGNKADSIIAGAGDLVYGGAGNDSIKLSKKEGDASILVGLAAAGGKDSVYSFTGGSGDDADVVYLFENGIGDGLKLELAEDKQSLLMTQGSAKLTLVNDDGDFANHKSLKIMDNTNTTYAVDFVSGTAAIEGADSMASIYYGDTAKKDNTLDFSKVDDSLVVDLGNTGAFQNTAGAAYAGSFASVKGGKAETILMGTANASETLTAGDGNTTLWGGGAKADVLDGGAGKENSVNFFYTAGDGKDTVTNFTAGTADDNADVLYLSNVSATGITRDSKAITISTAESTDKLVVELGSGAADSVIQYTTDGQTVNQVKIGVSSKSNKWTYAESVQAYMGGKDNSLSVSADVDSANIWLDGSKGVTYENVTKVDASASSNTVVIAGNGSANETLIGGAGDSSLWGGAGTSDDTLKGTYGGTTTYYFGSGDGDDVITNTGSDDKVVLYNVALSDIKALDNSTSTMKITLNDGSTLSVKGMSTASVNTFQLGDGSTWNYDYGTKSWSQK